MVIGGGKTKALRNQRRRKQRGRKTGGPGQPAAAKGGKLGDLLRRIFAPGGRRGDGK